MRVLITGINGHIGRAIAKQLIQTGNEVIGIGRSECKVSGVFQYVHEDISDINFIKNISMQIKPCSIIIHGASSMSNSFLDQSIGLTNCLGTQQIIGLACKWSVEQFIYLSSIQVIGIPQCEQITENHPVKPLTVYHASKLYGEYLARIAENSGIRTVIFRIASPVGPGMERERIFSVFVKNALNNLPLVLLGQGTRRQSYVDVRDIALAVEKCISNEASGLYNIAGGYSITNALLAERCIKLLNSSSRIIFSERPDPEENLDWNISIEKISSQIGYTPKYNIDESITALGEEYENRDYK